MPSHDRRSAGRRRAWGRGPIILKFEPLERREVLSGGHGLPDLVASSFTTVSFADWNDTITAQGQITNQGHDTVATSFNVDVYASPNLRIGRSSVKVAQITIPGGLEPGQSVPFTTTLRLPSSPLPGMPADGIVFLNLKVDPQNQVPESNKRNNSLLGPPYDQAPVQIAPHLPSNLVSTAVGVFPTAAQWGGSLAVTAQIRNDARGDAPATRAVVVLTPAGIAPGLGSDVTLGSLTVPPLKGWQTVNLERTFQLPAAPPVALSGMSDFTLSILPDADYVTDASYPRVAKGGLGVDMAAIRISMPPGTSVPDPGPLPGLAAGSVTTASGTLKWGQPFQVQTTVQNLGQADPGPFRVRFLLIGQNGDIHRAIFLGDAIVPGLPPGYDQAIVQELSLPSRLPQGFNLGSVGYARIAVVVDPENTVNEVFRNNNVATSAPVTLKLVGADGTSFVPTTPEPGQAPTPKAPPIAKRRPFDPASGRKLYRRPPPKPKDGVAQELSVFPSRVGDFFKKLI